MSLVYSEDYRKHETGNHPENMERLHVIMNSLEEEGCLEKIDVLEPEAATLEDIARVHTRGYLENVKSFCNNGGGYWDFDTLAAPETYKIAKLAAGGAIKASELVLNCHQSAYSLARPPGHHARKDNAMGFCFFNNLAIALEYLREIHGIKKFLIFDFDVHYGNGTAEKFYEDPNVLYISIHQDPRTIFPGKGFIEEMGADEGEGYNLNIPLPPGSTDKDYIFMLDHILEPAAKEFGADFYFLDVGFDGHRDDPLSGIQLSDDFYPWIVGKMCDIAGSMVLILEGGYNFAALSRCNVKLINVLMDQVTNEYRKYEKDVYTRKMNVSNEISNETNRIFHRIQDQFSPFFEF